MSMKTTAAAKKTRTINVEGIAVARVFGDGWIVFVRGEVLRTKRAGRPHNERVFATQEFALLAGVRARK